MNRTAGIALFCGAIATSELAAYDPMEDLLSSAKKEIKARDAIDASKSRADSDPRRQKVAKGYWQFFQARRDARPREFCTAVFWKGDRMISLSGPGGAYRGAMLGFVAIEPKNGFPRPDDAQATRKVQVTLTQGDGAPVRLTALNRTVGGMADEIAFAVPTIDAALAGIEDVQAFRISHDNQPVFDMAWHSGLAASQVLRRCLAGETVTGREVP